MIISRTPFRVSFFGGGTDYPAWYRSNGGQVLATTIDKYCYLTCRYLPPFFEHKISVAYSKIENCHSVDEIEHPAVRQILKYLAIDRGVAIKYDGDIPARSGMGSSSAFTVGLLHALHALKGNIPSKGDLARESIYVEQELLKETVGSQDQMLAAFGGLNHVVFHANNEVTIRPMTLSRDRIKELESHLVLFYTGVTRTASAIAQSYGLQNRERELRRLSEMVTEGIAILASRRDIHEFGELLHEAWQAKQALSPLVSNSHVAEMYEAARSAGAIGGKLLGAGGGGFMLLFCPPEAQPVVREKLAGLIHVPFNFEFSGSQIIYFEPDADYSQEEKLREARPPEPFQELAHLGERPEVGLA